MTGGKNSRVYGTETNSELADLDEEPSKIITLPGNESSKFSPRQCGKTVNSCTFRTLRVLRWKLVGPAGFVFLLDPIVFLDDAIVFFGNPMAFLHNPIVFLANPMVFLDNPMAFFDAPMVYPDVPMAFLGKNQVRSIPCLEMNHPNIFLEVRKVCKSMHFPDSAGVTNEACLTRRHGISS